VAPAAADVVSVFSLSVDVDSDRQQAGTKMATGENDDRSSLEIVCHGPNVRHEQRRTNESR